MNSTTGISGTAIQSFCSVICQTHKAKKLKIKAKALIAWYMVYNLSIYHKFLLFIYYFLMYVYSEKQGRPFNQSC